MIIHGFQKLPPSCKLAFCYLCLLLCRSLWACCPILLTCAFGALPGPVSSSSFLMIPSRCFSSNQMLCLRCFLWVVWDRDPTSLFRSFFSPFFQHHLLKGLPFSCWTLLAPLSNTKWPCMPGFHSGSLFCSTGLCVCVCAHTTLLLLAWTVVVWNQEADAFALFSPPDGFGCSFVVPCKF